MGISKLAWHREMERESRSNDRKSFYHGIFGEHMEPAPRIRYPEQQENRVIVLSSIRRPVGSRGPFFGIFETEVPDRD